MGFEILSSTAPRIIYVNTPKGIINYRIWKRFIKRKLGFENRTKKETLRGLFDLIKWNNNQMVEIDKLIMDLSKEKDVDIIRDKREIKQLKENLL